MRLDQVSDLSSNRCQPGMLNLNQSFTVDDIDSVPAKFHFRLAICIAIVVFQLAMQSRFHDIILR